MKLRYNAVPPYMKIYLMGWVIYFTSYFGRYNYSASFTIFSHALFSVRFPIISGVFESIFLCRILFIVPRVAKSVAITAKK